MMPQWWIHIIPCLLKQEWALDVSEVSVLVHRLYQVEGVDGEGGEVQLKGREAMGMPHTSHSVVL